MGRRDAVQVTLEFAAEWRRDGARVTFEPGWERRGNGLQANYEGPEVHHTGFGSGPANVLPAKATLIGGRPDLPGPLCNSTGPWCAADDPWIHVIAAFPANHAGASGGRRTAPYPVTGLFNPLVWGHEIDYGGNVPMSAGQRLAALIVSRGVCNVLGKDASWIKAHAETSVTGKWDPGYAPGKTVDMDVFRRDAFSSSFTVPEDFMGTVPQWQIDAHFAYWSPFIPGKAGEHSAVQEGPGAKAVREIREALLRPGIEGKQDAGAVRAALARIEGMAAKAGVADVDEELLANELAPKLFAGLPSGVQVSEEQLVGALRTIFAGLAVGDSDTSSTP